MADNSKQPPPKLIDVNMPVTDDGGNQTDGFRRAKLSDECATCSRWSGQNFACTAFPDGIPEPIRNAKVSHMTPYDGDHGMQWDLIKLKM